MKEYTITLPVYWKPSKAKTVMVGLNWWRNAHFRVLHNIKLFFEGLVLEDLKGEPMLVGPVEVHYKVYLKRKNSDGGNVGALASKFFLDGAVKAGIIKDDNASIVIRESFEYFYDKEFPRCEILIKECPG